MGAPGSVENSQVWASSSMKNQALPPPDHWRSWIKTIWCPERALDIAKAFKYRKNTTKPEIVYSQEENEWLPVGGWVCGGGGGMVSVDLRFHRKLNSEGQKSCVFRSNRSRLPNQHLALEARSSKAESSQHKQFLTSCRNANGYRGELCAGAFLDVHFQGSSGSDGQKPFVFLEPKGSGGPKRSFGRPNTLKESLFFLHPSDLVPQY